MQQILDKVKSSTFSWCVADQNYKLCESFAGLEEIAAVPQQPLSCYGPQHVGILLQQWHV